MSHIILGRYCIVETGDQQFEVRENTPEGEVIDTIQGSQADHLLRVVGADVQFKSQECHRLTNLLWTGEDRGTVTPDTSNLEAVPAETVADGTAMQRSLMALCFHAPVTGLLGHSCTVFRSEAGKLFVADIMRYHQGVRFTEVPENNLQNVIPQTSGAPIFPHVEYYGAKQNT